MNNSEQCRTDTEQTRLPDPCCVTTAGPVSALSTTGSSVFSTTLLYCTFFSFFFFTVDRCDTESVGKRNM